MSKKEKSALDSHRVARFVSVDEHGDPLVVPVCFVLRDDFLYTPIDSKPKEVSALELKRVRNIIGNSKVSFLVDHYDEDWSKLYYIIIYGKAELLYDGDEYRVSLKALTKKYNQYKKMDLENLGLPVIKIIPDRIISWGNL